jgi:hypothetical protein
MHLTRAPLLALLVAGCAGTADAPTPVSTTPNSRAAVLAGDYTLTITIDEQCTQVPTRDWTYRATLDGTGGYLSLSVTGAGFSERTDVGQMYTYPDFSARFIWNFADPEVNYPDPRIYGARLLLYGASETKIVNGTMSGTIRGSVSTTLNFNAQCYGLHRFTMISTGP